MKHFYNPLEEYGDCGPHEANNTEELAIEMEELFQEWYEENPGGKTPEQMRKEFEDNLIEQAQCAWCEEWNDVDDTVECYDYTLCRSCDEDVTMCDCGQLMGKDQYIMTRAQTLEEPAEYGCPACANKKRYTLCR